MKLTMKNFILLVLMLVATSLGVLLKPTHKIANENPEIDLENMIPKQFGAWKIDPSIIPLLASPEAQETLDVIYSQVLARSYVDSEGNRVMLSIAYGSDQSDAMRVHKPEVCYRAQGFDILNKRSDVINNIVGNVPVIKLVAKQGRRVEPITYWVVVGNKVSSSGLMQKITQLKYGLRGEVPDGVLFRVSTIGNTQLGFKIQQSFIDDLLMNMTEQNRLLIVGDITRTVQY